MKVCSTPAGTRRQSVAKFLQLLECKYGDIFLNRSHGKHFHYYDQPGIVSSCMSTVIRKRKLTHSHDKQSLEMVVLVLSMERHCALEGLWTWEYRVKITLLHKWDHRSVFLLQDFYL